jgi:hypothetical protein
MHGKKIQVTGPPENREIKAFNNVRFYKTDISGKCDSLHSNNKTALTQLIGKPVIWNFDSQMTGDVMHLIGNNSTQKLDSLKVLNNAFLIQKDTITADAYNQIKGQNLYGRFENNKLKKIDIVKNTEVIFYMNSDEDELIGINKSLSSAINLELNDNKIETITFIKNTDGIIYPEKEFPKNARKLRGFKWRGDERINSKEEIFTEEENSMHEKILIESKKKNAEEDVPMEILEETLNYDKNNPKKKK